MMTVRPEGKIGLQFSAPVINDVPKTSTLSRQTPAFKQCGNGLAFSAGGVGKPYALATSICQERPPGANKRNSQIPGVSNAQVKSQHSIKPSSSSNLCLTQPFSGTQTYWNTICGANSLPIPPRTADRFGPLMVTVRRMKTQVPFRIRQTSHRY